jgi:hypothetical protein
MPLQYANEKNCSVPTDTAEYATNWIAVGLYPSSLLCRLILFIQNSHMAFRDSFHVFVDTNRYLLSKKGGRTTRNGLEINCYQVLMTPGHQKYSLFKLKNQHIEVSALII